jgi:hypothetical protein
LLRWKETETLSDKFFLSISSFKTNIQTSAVHLR